MTFISFKSPRSAKAFTLVLPLALLSAACSGGALVGATTTGTGGAGSTASTGTGTGTSTGTAGGSGTGGTGGTGGDAGIPDTTAPSIIATHPMNGDGGVSIAVTLSATFDEAMDPLTLTSKSFTLTQGASEIPGAVSYFDKTAVFLPSSALALGTTYIATITTMARDSAGNPLAEDHSWSFKTDVTAPLGPAPVLLGAAGNYVILAKSAISNVPTSMITGDLGLSPAAASYITGFSLTKAGTHWTTPQVTGQVFAADNDPPTPSDLTTAVADMQTAYTDAAGRPTPDFVELGSGAIGGLTLAPGLYKWTSSVTIPGDVTIAGGPNDTWIFQVAGDLTLSAAKAMTLIGGARAQNVVWQVAGEAKLGATAHAEGIVLAKTAIKLSTGASINGRLLAQTAVDLAGATVVAPAP